MLRQVSRQFVSRAAGFTRPLTTSALRAEDVQSQHATEKFAEAWRSVNPEYLSVPAFNGQEYLSETPPDHEAGQALPDKLKFNFFMPHNIEMKDEEVEMVLVPATAGDFGILPGHVPTVAQLRPGVMSVHKNNDQDIQKFFVSSGFAFIHANSTAEVCAVEAVPLEQLDAAAVEQSLEEYTSLLISATDDYGKAQAQIGIEVCSAMKSALQTA